MQHRARKNQTGIEWYETRGAQAKVLRVYCRSMETRVSYARSVRAVEGQSVAGMARMFLEAFGMKIRGLSYESDRRIPRGQIAPGVTPGACREPCRLLRLVLEAEVPQPG